MLLVALLGNAPISEPASCSTAPGRLDCVCADGDPEGVLPVTAADLRSDVRQLKITQCRVPVLTRATLAGLGAAETFATVLALDLRRNAIAHMDASFLALFPKVQTMLLNDNAITTVALGPPLLLPDVIYLSLGVNQLTEIPAHALAAFSGLLTLELDKNNVTMMHPAALLPPGAPATATHPLVTLSLFRNHIADLANPPDPFGAYTSLQTLDLRENYYTSLPARLLDPLKDSLNSLRLQAYDDVGLPMLEADDDTLAALAVPHALSFLDLRNQAVLVRAAFAPPEFVPVATAMAAIVRGLTAFAKIPSQLTLSSCKLTAMPAIVRRAPNLGRLLIDKNEIATLDIESFRGLDTLVSLTITSNVLTRIGRGTFDYLSAGPALSTGPLQVLEMGDNPTICRLESSPRRILCTCAPGLVGDGTFCEVACPATLPAPAGAAPVACENGLWHGAVCGPANGTHYVCDEGTWVPATDAATHCPCSKSGPTCIIISCRPTHPSMPINIPSNTVLLGLDGSMVSSIRRDFGWNLGNLEVLNLYDSKITAINPGSFNGLRSLTDLRIGRNPIRQLPMPSFLPIFHGLNRLIMDSCTELESLDLDPISRMPTLQKLWIHNLQAHSNTFMSFRRAPGTFPKLDYLDLSVDSLPAVPPFVANITSLLALNLKFNPITRLTANQFEGLTNLRTLLIGALFSLESIDFNTFVSLPHLVELSLISDVATCVMANNTLDCTCATPDGDSAPDSAPTICTATCAAFSLPPELAAGARVLECTGTQVNDQCRIGCTDPALADDQATFLCHASLAWLQTEVSGPVDDNGRLSCPAPAAPTSNSSGGGGGGDSITVAAAVAAVVVVVAVVAAVMAVRRHQRKSSTRQRSILGEMMKLMELPHARAQELYAAKFGSLLGDSDECSRRLAELELGEQYDVRFGGANTVLGVGEHGRVVRADLHHLGTGAQRPVAAKLLHEGSFNGHACVNLLLEARVLAMLEPHEHLVGVVGLHLRHVPIYVLVEYCELGDLRSFLAGGAVPATATRDLTDFAAQVAAGGAFLHSKMIIHRDLAARNVLVQHAGAGGRASLPGSPWQRRYLLKLADLGLSRGLISEADGDKHKSGEKSGRGGSAAEVEATPGADTEGVYLKQSDDRVPVKWMCPTAVALRRFTTKSDVWSFGVLSWEIFSLGAAPYAELLATEVQVKTSQGFRLPCPPACPPGVYELLLACWHKEEAKRPSLADAAARLRRLAPQRSAWAEEAPPPGPAAVVPGDTGRMVLSLGSGAFEERPVVLEMDSGANFELEEELEDEEEDEEESRI